MLVRMARVIFSAEALLMMFGLVKFAPEAIAQNNPLGDHRPWPCTLVEPVSVDRTDPIEEQEYESSFNEFYRLWCSPDSGPPQARSDVANHVAARWKKLWYRDTPFNAAFHETGSFELLVLIAITRKLPDALTSDPVFMKDWLSDCSDRCFMIYGEDDPSAKQERLRMLRFRNDVIANLRNSLRQNRW